jgi:hypothetical protein
MGVNTLVAAMPLMVLKDYSLVYPDGRAEEFLVVVDLLKSNGVVEHYDLMRRYARREGK